MFVAKLNPTGSTVLYTTYLGSGKCNASAGNIAVDANGNAYATGMYGDVDQWGYCNNRYVLTAKLNGAGATTYYYYWGGGDGYGNAVAVDANGYAYYTGKANGSWPVTAGAYQTSGGFPGDAFVLKLDPNGNPVYSTYLGGSGIDEGSAIALDSAGNAYVAGSAQSYDFPVTANAYQPANHGFPNGFITKLNAAGSALLYSTYLGGTRGEGISGIAVDQFGKIYVVGASNSNDFPTTANAYDRTCGSDGVCNPAYDGIWHYAEDIFFSKLDPALSGAASLVYSTFFGGTNRDMGNAIAVNAAGHAIITGRTGSLSDFPTRNPVQPAIGGDYDAVVVEFDPTQSGAASLVFSTYYGGALYDEGTAVAVDSGNNIYIAGFTASTNFPTLAPLQGANAGGNDAFVAKFGVPAGAALGAVALNPAAITGGVYSTGTVTLTSAAPAGGAVVTLSSNNAAATVPASVTVAAAPPARPSMSQRTRLRSLQPLQSRPSTVARRRPRP